MQDEDWEIWEEGSVGLKRDDKTCTGKEARRGGGTPTNIPFIKF